MPTFNYVPPPAVGQPAVVQAVLPAPEPPEVPVKEFGEPVWVKSIKTVSHNNHPIELRELVSDDPDDATDPNWKNGEVDEVEIEWRLLQEEFNNPDNPKNEEVGQEEALPGGDEIVTRRYEFYKYGAAANTLDGENGEAKCDEVNPTTDPGDPNYLHGVGNQVEVTDPFGEPYFVDCAGQVVVGDYIGAQMAGFNVEVPLGLIDDIQDGTTGEAYPERRVVIGGNTPYVTVVIPGGGLPDGLSLDPSTGILSGTPTTSGTFEFTVEATDSSNFGVRHDYSVTIAEVLSDSDGDGVPDDVDACPGFDDTVDVDGDGIPDGCDPLVDSDGDGVANSVDICPVTASDQTVDPDTGCSIAQLVPCDGPRGTATPWRNHGKYVSMTARTAKRFVARGLIARSERGSIISRAARSTCGRKK